MLNSKLADFAMNLEHAEEKIWRCWAMYQGTSFDGEIFYPRSFSIQDKANDVAMLKMAKEANIGDVRINEELDKKIYETITEGFYEDLPNNQTPVQKNMMEHPPVTNVNDMVTHLREMVTGGYTDEEIKQLHPELAELFTRGE